MVSPSGKYVFVMFAPPEFEMGRGESAQKIAERQQLRRTYAHSGMYRNDGSAEPLWTVDWYASGVVVSSDGSHLIRYGEWATTAAQDWSTPSGQDLEQPAVSFYANGQLLRTYPAGELIDVPSWLPRSASHFEWLNKASLDDAGLEFSLTTLDGNRFVFDVPTGQIISESRLGRRVVLWAKWVILGTLPPFLALTLFLWRRLGRPFTRPSC
jgi:hypothetical protein